MRAFALAAVVVMTACAPPEPVPDAGPREPFVPECPWPSQASSTVADVNEQVNVSFELVEKGGAPTTVHVQSIIDSAPGVFDHGRVGDLPLPPYDQAIVNGVFRAPDAGTFTRTFRFGSTVACDGPDEFSIRVTAVDGRLAVSPPSLELGDFPLFTGVESLRKTRFVTLTNVGVTPPDDGRVVSLRLDSVRNIEAPDFTPNSLVYTWLTWIDGGTQTPPGSLFPSDLKLRPGESAILRVSARVRAMGAQSRTLGLWNARFTMSGTGVPFENCDYRGPNTAISVPADGGIGVAYVANVGTTTCMFDGFHLAQTRDFFELLEPQPAEYRVDAGASLQIRVKRGTASPPSSQVALLIFGASSSAAPEASVWVQLQP